jgi:chromatin assembly factor 1 subunit B
MNIYSYSTDSKKVGDAEISVTPFVKITKMSILKNRSLPASPLQKPMSSLDSTDSISTNSNQDPPPSVSSTNTPDHEKSLSSEQSTLQNPTSKPVEKSYTFKIFHDDTLSSFFRRLQFSPDGSLLAVPCGLYPDTTSKVSSKETEMLNTVYFYSRGGLSSEPLFHLPGHKKPAIAVRFNPVRFKYRSDEAHQGTNRLSLPYRLLVAVATQDTVVIYDTCQTMPFAVLGNLHYGQLTDIAW